MFKEIKDQKLWHRTINYKKYKENSYNEKLSIIESKNNECVQQQII